MPIAPISAATEDFFRLVVKSLFSRKGLHLWGFYRTGLFRKPKDFVANSDFTPLGVPGVQLPHPTELGKVSVKVTIFKKSEGVCTAWSTNQVLRLITAPAISLP